MRIALYQPDIPQNTGTILRLAACLGLDADLIEPAGFPTTDRAFRRAGMDYLDQVRLTRHASFGAFEAFRAARGLRLVLLTTAAATPYLEHRFSADDVLLLGRESGGVPERVHALADVRLVIPMRTGLRSLNVAMACAMTVGEALRQTGGPGPSSEAFFGDLDPHSAHSRESVNPGATPGAMGPRFREDERNAYADTSQPKPL